MEIAIKKETKFCIGGIVISVSSTDPIEINNRSSYAHFVSSAEPEVKLRLRAEGIPNISARREPYRHKKGIARYYREGRRHTFVCFDSDTDTEPRMAAFMEDDFLRGDIYIIKPVPGAASSIPLEYPFDEMLMVSLLSRGRGALMHACGAIFKGDGLLFAGLSGNGKSTIAGLLRTEDGTTVLNDDRIIVRKESGEFFIYGTPWHGDIAACSSRRAPLKRIFFLKHAKENSTGSLSLMDSVTRLFTCTFPAFWDKDGMEFTLGFLDELAGSIPSYELSFLPDKGAIQYLKNIT